MGLIDSNILLQGGQNTLGQSFGQGLDMASRIQQMRQNQAQQARQNQARQAFTQAAQGEDITKPEGMGNAIRKFAEAGFPNEASAVLEAHKDMFAQPKTTGTENVWSDLPNAEKPTLYNKQTAETKILDVPGKPKGEGKDPWTGTTWVKSGGKMKMVDAYGNDKAGNPVTIDKDPEKPLGGAVLLGSYLRDWSKSKFDYEKVAKPYLAMKSIVNSKAYGTGVGDQSMIDKLIMIETGKVPTEAQYFQFAHNLGIDDKIDRLTGRLKNGAILGPETRQRMLDEADEQMTTSHDAYNSELEQAKAQVTDAGIDPHKTIRTGGYYDEVSKHLAKRKAAAQSAAPASQEKIDKAKAYMALPPDSPYRSPAHEAAAKAILGIQ